MKNTYCAECGELMERWGKTAAGTPRYRCAACRKSSIIHRPDTHVRHDKNRFVEWLTGVENKNEIAKKYGITRRALTKEFGSFFRTGYEPSIPADLEINLLIVDAKYIHGSELCALVAVTESDHIFWQFASEECYGTWYGFLIKFPAPRIVVADGQKGMSRFVKRHWPGTAFQRCHFHVVLLVTHYLSRNPKEEAGRVILDLVHQLRHIKTVEARDRWKLFHVIWEKQYAKVFNLKNESGDYVHRKLRSVRFVMRRALPNLFTYLEYPGCPNTTNLVEGWVNTAIAEGLRRHRGLKLSQKKTLVSIILSHLKRPPREKPTRKFP